MTILDYSGWNGALPAALDKLGRTARWRIEAAGQPANSAERANLPGVIRSSFAGRNAS